MFPNMNQYMKAKYGNLPHIEVSREEYIRLSVEAGMTKEKAEFNAAMAAGLGAHTMIGEQMVGIKEDPPAEDKKDA